MQNELSREIEKLLEELRQKPYHPFPALRGKLVTTEEDERDLDRKGVYIIYSPQGEVEHVGSTPRAKGGLADRLRGHLSGSSSYTYTRFGGDGSRLRDGYKFQYLVVDSGRKRALVEALGIGRLCPVHIGHGFDNSEPNSK